jgi:hypothetical protein
MMPVKERIFIQYHNKGSLGDFLRHVVKAQPSGSLIVCLARAEQPTRGAVLYPSRLRNHPRDLRGSIAS